jgi:hypothetical protein
LAAIPHVLGFDVLDRWRDIFHAALLADIDEQPAQGVGGRGVLGDIKACEMLGCIAPHLQPEG